MIVILKLTFDLMFGGGTGIHCSTLYDGDFKCNFSIFNFMNSLNHTTKLWKPFVEAEIANTQVLNFPARKSKES